MKFLRKNVSKINEVIDLYKSGYSLTSIQNKLGIDRHLLSKMVKSENIEIRVPGFYAKGRKLSKKHIKIIAEAVSKANKGRTAHNKLSTVKAIYRNIRSGAKKRNLTFSLTISQVKKLVFSNCFYCNSPPKREYRYRTNEPINGIDRVNSLKGYSMNNCVPCCSECNRMKMDDTVENFLNQIKKIAKFKILV